MTDVHDALAARAIAAGFDPEAVVVTCPGWPSKRGPGLVVIGPFASETALNRWRFDHVTYDTGRVACRYGIKGDQHRVVRIGHLGVTPVELIAPEA
jgi:hypothetical protein